MSHLRLALAVGAVGGALLGCRETLISLQANAVAQPGDYFLLFAAVPLLAWVALGPVLMLPIGVAGSVLFGARPAAALLPRYAAMMVLLGAASILVPWATGVADLLRSVGVAPGLGTWLLLATLAGPLALGAALLVRALVAAHLDAVRRALRAGLWVTLVSAAVAMWPVVRFFLNDWKWDTTASATAQGGDARPNVLLISIDTLRADHLGSYGDTNGLTPNLDRLAADGVVFEETVTSAPWTLPAMASLFTGLYPRRHGAGQITDHWTPLGRSALRDGWTLATALREAGYRNHAIVTNPYLALRYGFGQGFDTYQNVTIESEAFLSFRSTTAVRLLTWLRPEWVVGDRGEVVSERASRWLATADGERPFFLWLHYLDPHPPYSRAGATRHKSLRGDLSFQSLAGEHVSLTLTSPDVARLRSGEIRLNDDEKAAVHALYRAEVVSVDAAVGEVLAALDAHGLREQTLVIVVADHGEEFWDHGGVEHGHTVYEEVVRVPLLMRWPKHLPAGTRVGSLARIIDVAPTALDALGVAAPTDRDGVSLLPLVRDPQQVAARSALIENMLFADERIGVRTADRKYVRWAYGKEEVYDLEHDPREQRDLAGLETVIGPLRNRYAALDRQLGAAAPAPAATLDERTTNAMRALGYVR